MEIQIRRYLEHYEIFICLTQNSHGNLFLLELGSVECPYSTYNVVAIQITHTCLLFLEMSKVHTVLSQTWEREFELTHTGIIYWKIQSSAAEIYCQVFKTNSQARQKFAE